MRKFIESIAEEKSLDYKYMEYDTLFVKKDFNSYYLFFFLNNKKQLVELREKTVDIFSSIKKNKEIYRVDYKFPNLPYYRGAADQVFFLGRPLGRFGLSSAGFFLGLPRFLGAGLGIGFERPRASSSSNT